jgi:hypothetical protein
MRLPFQDRSMVKNLLFFIFLFLVSPSWFNEGGREIKVCSLVSFSFNFNDAKKDLKVYLGWFTCLCLLMSPKRR